MLEAHHAANITAAFVFGSMTKGTHHAGSDVDLMVIGDDLDYAGLYSSLQRAELKLHRPIKPLFMSTSDWQQERAEKDSFVQKISARRSFPLSAPSASCAHERPGASEPRHDQEAQGRTVPAQGI
jgi:hypothetical protein